LFNLGREGGLRIFMANVVNAFVKVNSDLDSALKRLRKKIEKEGLIKEIKKNMYYEKPTQRRRRKMLKARKKMRRMQEKMARYDRY
jgi:small subunit ribosomal protein S21